ncbi:hypothetical protein FVP99_01860 [Microbacterium wangchenii]|nr:hypothetical protein FVP99_01860 [Microbacterium wangchenii]
MLRFSSGFLVSRTVLAACALAVTAGITGCTASGPAASTSESQTPTIAPSPATSTSTVTDIETCEAFTDVSTILQNAGAGLYEGRMSQKEYDGWMRLATRVLDRVPTRGEGAVSDAIAALKTEYPPIPAGTQGVTGIGKPVPNTVPSPVDACDAVGYQIFGEGFTGG